MPHIIAEYSKELESSFNIIDTLSDLHHALGAQQDVALERIKTRAYPIEHAIVCDQGTEGLMMHITVLVLAGRTQDVKTAYGQSVYEAAKKHVPDLCKLTLEVRDMDPENYIL